VPVMLALFAVAEVCGQLPPSALVMQSFRLQGGKGEEALSWPSSGLIRLCPRHELRHVFKYVSILRKPITASDFINTRLMQPTVKLHKLRDEIAQVAVENIPAFGDNFGTPLRHCFGSRSYHPKYVRGNVLQHNQADGTLDEGGDEFASHRSRCIWKFSCVFLNELQQEAFGARQLRILRIVRDWGLPCQIDTHDECREFAFLIIGSGHHPPAYAPCGCAFGPFICQSSSISRQLRPAERRESLTLCSVL
jgi:hypothetical protein